MDNVSGIFPLTPPQSGMLFHSLQHPDDGTYVVQYTCRVHGDVDARRLRQAWADTVQAHPALKAAFLYEGLDQPMQVVRTEVTLPWIEKDWSDLDSAGWETRLESALAEDRELGFELAQAPLVRITWVKLAEDLHQLIWTYHHIIADGWSSVLLMDEVWERYLEPGRHRPPPPGFGDFVTWSGRRDRAGSEAYWRARLEGSSLPTASQLERPKPGAPAGHRRNVRSLSAAASERLREFARLNRLTLSTVVHGAWALTQARTSNTDDVVYGATVSGRPADMPDVDRIVGAFINTLPVRVDAGSKQPVVPWLRELQDQLLELRNHELDALGDVARWTGVRAADLFDAILVFENAPDTQSPLAGTGLRISDVRYFDQSNYGFALLVVPSEELEFHAVFRPDRVAPAAADRLLDLVIQTLEALPSTGNATVAELGPPWAGERAALEGNSTDDRSVAPVDVLEAFLAHAERAPDAMAVRSPGGELTYGELMSRAASIRRELETLGVEAGQRVGILAPKGHAFVSAVLGTLWAGASYVPIDPAYPRQRIELMLGISGVSHVLASGDLEPLAREVMTSVANRPEVVVIESALVDAEAHVVEVGPAVAAPANEAYVIFTSGSTGQPKGVSVSRSNLAHSNAARSAVYGEEKPTYLLLSPVGFDSSVAGLFWPLSVGGTLAMVAPDVERDPRALGQEVRRLQVSMTLCVPSFYQLILDAAADDLQSLTTVIVAGEACPSTLVHAHAQRLPHAELVNEYGPTECTVWSTFARLTPASVAQGVPIGRPIPRAFVRVLDEQGRLVPRGVAGELYVGGPTVANGYVGLESETRSRFVSDARGSTGSEMYRTGDRVRIAHDGTLYFLGRTDTQVKVRGFRIEPAEVEAALMTHPDVVECAVVARVLGTSETPTLVGYLATASGDALDTTPLRGFLRAQLPDFMIPSLFVPMARLPRTPHGKVDARALPRPDGVRSGRDPEPSRARSEVEKALHELWASALGAQELGLTTSFFEMGGDSLTGIRLLGRIRDRWGVDLSMQTLFDRPTIAQIAEDVEAILWARSSDGEVSPEQDDWEEVEF